MKKSDSIHHVAAALVKFQAEVVDPAKDGNNPHFKSKFVELNDLLAAVRPILTKHGLAIMQEPSGNGADITITTILLHESGEWIELEPLMLKAQKTDPQGAGSAITYGRRYALSAVLGVAWDDDDDGNSASNNPKKTKSEETSKFQEAQQAIAAEKEQERSQSGSNLKWDTFWNNVKVFGLNKEQVHMIASEVFQKEVSSLTDVIATQNDLNKFTAELRRRMQKAG